MRLFSGFLDQETTVVHFDWVSLSPSVGDPFDLRHFQTWLDGATDASAIAAPAVRIPKIKELSLNVFDLIEYDVRWQILENHMRAVLGCVSS